MMSFIAANLGTIIISIILLLAVVLAVRSVIKDKKKGACSCGTKCGGCAMEGSCHCKQ